MADIAAADVTYTMVDRKKDEKSYQNNTVKLEFGNSTLTYPSGGIPLTMGKLGTPRNIVSLKIFDDSDSDGLIYKYDFVNKKIRIYRSAGFTPAGTNAQVTGTISQVTGTISAGVIAVTAGTAGDAVTNNAGVLESSGGQDLAVEEQTFTGSTPTFTGSTPTFTGTAVAAGNLVELVAATTAPAATVLYVEVIGY